jgi:hypothetical protein
MFTTAWGLWQARNSFFGEEKMTSVEEICQKSAGLSIDFLEAGLDIQKEGVIVEIVGASRWRPPEEGIFKVNIACKFCSNLLKLGVGVLVRDSSCLVIAARTFTLRITGEILQSVAMTAVESIRFIEIGVLRVELEFDHKDLFCLIQQVRFCLASINNLVDNIILSKRYFEILSFLMSQHYVTR